MGTMVTIKYTDKVTDEEATVIHRVFSRIAPPPPSISPPVTLGIKRNEPK